MNIVGISAYYHESACCLLQDGRLLAAAEEERFSRVKHDPSLPVAAFRYCLDSQGLDITDVDCVAYYESPTKKLSRQLWAGRRPRNGVWFDPLRPLRDVREVLGFEGRIECFDHHLSHAASSFYFSGFDTAAILCVDGVGEWASTSYGRGGPARIDLLEEVCFPHSLGLLYSTITAYLGFGVNRGEYKVMGLAPYGAPRFLEPLRHLVRSLPRGQFELDQTYFDYVQGERMFSHRLPELLGAPARQPEAELTRFHKDVARSAQALLEELLLEKVGYLRELVDAADLCMAGGVALNCVANGRIVREGPFDRMFVQPAAGDAGACLGAAALAHVCLTGERPGRLPLTHVGFGPRYACSAIQHLLATANIGSSDFRNREPQLLHAVVDRLVAGQVVGWFHGAMEFGPRALGARSILADPRDPGMREHINRAVKKREAFRPFAPSILARCAHQHVDLEHVSPFMLETCQVRSGLDLPAITHVDGSARPQTVDPLVAPRYASLLEAFYARTGCPMLVNTSFNVADEPIVCSPADAIRCFIHSALDSLVLEDFVVDRKDLPPEVHELARNQAATAARQSAISSILYTFI